MGNKPQQDVYVDEGENTCPLCVEEFDLSDRNFRPCPCGYQVCQFCFNNIKSNMNGLCPACRRPYDDKTIEWKVVSPEEFKADVAAQARRKAAARQKEAERKQVETLNKKHLAGLRVLQKNLVYVVGMDISGDEHALETLRGPNHFGQYGEIIKIVASKVKEGYAGHQSTGIYVTFARKEDAATCIAAIDGTPHDDRVLRAQYGTTKYCSSYLRNERCTNRNCMFLHETGDDGDSFSRQDLSSFNAASSQRSAPSAASPGSRVTYQNPTQMASPSITSASAIQGIRSEAMSRSDSGDPDGPALPTTATWAKNPQIEQSRRSSQAVSRATPSPKPMNAKLVLPRPESRTGKAVAESKSKGKKASTKKNMPVATVSNTGVESKAQRLNARSIWIDAMKRLGETDFTFRFDRTLFDASTLAIVDNHPPLFSLNEGILQLVKRKERERNEIERATDSEQPSETVNDDLQFASGSLQLGGEPENGDDFLTQRSSRGQTPFGASADSQAFNRQSGAGSDFADLTLSGRSLTPQQQRNISLLKSTTASQDSAPSSMRGPGTSQHQSQLSNPFQSQNQQLNALSRHGRQTSRFTFNENGSGSNPIKPSAGASTVNQMANNLTKGYNNTTQPGMQSAFYSGVQGPPPGLKASGTPPISGGGMFGQGHGFASAMGGASSFSGNVGKPGNDDNTRDMLRSRLGGDAGKVDLTDPSILQARIHHSSGGANQSSYNGSQNPDFPSFDELNAGLPQLPQIASLRGQSRSATPSIPPGFGATEFPPLTPPSKTASITTGSPKTVKPAIPLLHRPETPKAISATGMPAMKVTDDDASKIAEKTMSTGPITGTSTKDTATKSNSIEPIGTARRKQETRVAKEQKAADVASAKVSKTAEQPPKARDKKLNDSAGIAFATVESSTVVDEPMNNDRTEASSSVKERSIKDSSTKDHIKTAISTSAIEASPSSPNDKVSKPQAPPLKRNPRTLRLVETMKIEEPSSVVMPLETSDLPRESTLAKSSAQNSGRTSTKQPSTPNNELISENVSLTSASVSRPGTPSLSSRIHVGPTITKSKNQIKKERQARAKQMEEADLDIASIPDEPTQAPILARKKKTKKAKEPSTAHNSSRVPSGSTAAFTTASASESQGPSLEDAVETAKAMIDQYDGFVPLDNLDETAAAEADLNNQPNYLTYTVASVFADLKREGILTSSDIEYYLNPTGLNTRYDISTRNVFDYEQDVRLDLEEQEILECGDAVAKEINPGEWGVVLPDRSVLRHFTKEEAYRYVDLKMDFDHNPTDTFNSTEFPIEAWSNFTSNDIISGLQIAPALDGSRPNYVYSTFDPPEPLISEFATGLLRPDAKDESYGVMYPPRNEAENEEIEARMAMYTREEADQTINASEELLIAAKRETEQLEKKLMALVKKNRKILKDWNKTTVGEAGVAN